MKFKQAPYQAVNIVTVRKRSCGKVLFSEVCVKNSVHREVCMVGGHAWWGHVWQGGMHGRGACVVGGMCDRGHTWQGACVVGGCVAGEHAWWRCAWPGGMHCRGVCMAGGHALQEIQPLQRTVRILLECILICHRSTLQIAQLNVMR